MFPVMNGKRGKILSKLANELFTKVITAMRDTALKFMNEITSGCFVYIILCCFINVEV